jgi:hypothetical protein
MAYMGEKRNTAELQLSGIIGMASLPSMQKIRIIGLFFENSLHWQSEVEKNSANGCCKLYIYLRTNKSLIYNSLYIFENWGGGEFKS